MMAENLEKLSGHELYRDPGIDGRAYRFVVDNFDNLRDPEALFSLKSRGGEMRRELKESVDKAIVVIASLIGRDLRSVSDGIMVPADVKDKRTDGECELARLPEDERNERIFGFNRDNLVRDDEIRQRLIRVNEAGESLALRCGDLACLVEWESRDNFLLLGEYLKSLSKKDGLPYRVSGRFVSDVSLPEGFDQNPPRFWYELLRHRFNLVGERDNVPSPELLYALFHPNGNSSIALIADSTDVLCEEVVNIGVLDMFDAGPEKGSQVVVIPYVLDDDSFKPISRAIMAGKIIDRDGCNLIFEAKMELNFERRARSETVVRRISVEIGDDGNVSRVSEVCMNAQGDMYEENPPSVPPGGSDASRMRYQIFLVGELPKTGS